MPIRVAFALAWWAACLVGCRAVTVLIGLILIVAVMVVVFVIIIVVVIITLIRAEFLIQGFISSSHIPWPNCNVTFEVSTDVI
jgi:hypothetical protein